MLIPERRKDNNIVRYDSFLPNVNRCVAQKNLLDVVAEFK